MIYTPETLLTEIIDNPGISAIELRKECNSREKHRALTESLMELRFNSKIHVVRFTMWKYGAETSFHYFAAEIGSIEVADTMDDIKTVFEYDPYGTKKKALENA